MSFSVFQLPRTARALFAAAVALTLSAATQGASATTIERVVSPGGIEAWLVNEPSVPLIAMQFAFKGGANQDPALKPGVGYMAASLLDEGAGDLDSKAYQQRLEEKAIEISFSQQRDYLHGSLRVLRERRDDGFDMMRLALNAPRFDAPAVERIRSQIISQLRRLTTEPNDVNGRLWWKTAFPDHPYGRPVTGTLDSIPLIATDELRIFMKSVLARETLKVAVVGDIDAATLGPLLDKVFGALPEKLQLTPVPPANTNIPGRRIVVDLDVPQAVVMFGRTGIARKDPDFIAAYIVNHILGGSGFSSRLYTEVREKRGLAYGVSTYLLSLEHAALFMGATATRKERTGEALSIIDEETRRLAENGPTEKELDDAKAYLKGAYALAFDTSSKIAAQLLQIQIDDLGIDYINRRKALIDAVTMDDAKRVARRLLDGKMLVTVVGRPSGVASSQ